MSGTPDFVTISTAARLLGVSERHVRRLAGRLPDSDRQNGRGPAKVRLEALRVLCPEPENESGAVRQGAGDVRPQSDTEREIETLRANIERLTAERDGLAADKVRLNELLDRRDQAESEMRRLMLADKQEISELRQRLALTAAPDHPDAPPSRQDGRTAEEAGQGGTGGGTRRWWKFWERG